MQRCTVANDGTPYFSSFKNNLKHQIFIRMFFRHAAYTGEEPNRYIDFPRHFCHSRLTDRTGETCEASGPEGSCGSLSLFIPKKEMIRIAKPYKSYDDLLAFLQNDKNLII